jgi:hypothetical protein
MDNAVNNNVGYVTSWKWTLHCGSTVTISAYPADGYEFDHWEGEAYSTSSTPITVRVFNNDTEEKAYFRPIPSPPQPSSYNLQISINVDGSVTVLRSETYPAGTTVSASPITPTGYRFLGWSGVVNSSQESITFQMPGQNTELTANFTYEGNGGGSGDDGGGYNKDFPCFPGIDPGCYNSPIIINFENGGYRLTGRNAPVLFDMAGNGQSRPMGWTAAGADEAFLWLDRNHDGLVNNGAELFGNFTPLQNGQRARNGFDALRELDANGDGVIDERDPIWPRLMLWRDLNHNGVSEQNEILRIIGSDVTSIDLHDYWTGRHDTSGNLFRYESLVSINNSSGHGVHKQTVYDIFFPFRTFRSELFCLAGGRLRPPADLTEVAGCLFPVSSATLTPLSARADGRSRNLSSTSRREFAFFRSSAQNRLPIASAGRLNFPTAPHVVRSPPPSHRILPPRRCQPAR